MLRSSSQRRVLTRRRPLRRAAWLARQCESSATVATPPRACRSGRGEVRVTRPGPRALRLRRYVTHHRRYGSPARGQGRRPPVAVCDTCKARRDITCIMGVLPDRAAGPPVRTAAHECTLTSRIACSPVRPGGHECSRHPDACTVASRVAGVRVTPVVSGASCGPAGRRRRGASAGRPTPRDRSGRRRGRARCRPLRTTGRTGRRAAHPARLAP